MNPSLPEGVRTHLTTHKNPPDVEVMLDLARVLRAEGHLPEALLAAQQSFGENPHLIAAYTEADLAMIGLDRYGHPPVLMEDEEAKESHSTKRSAASVESSAASQDG